MKYRQHFCYKKSQDVWDLVYLLKNAFSLKKRCESSFFFTKHLWHWHCMILQNQLICSYFHGSQCPVPKTEMLEAWHLQFCILQDHRNKRVTKCGVQPRSFKFIFKSLLRLKPTKNRMPTQILVAGNQVYPRMEIPETQTYLWAIYLRLANDPYFMGSNLPFLYIKLRARSDASRFHPGLFRSGNRSYRTDLIYQDILSYFFDSSMRTWRSWDFCSTIFRGSELRPSPRIYVHH